MEVLSSASAASPREVPLTVVSLSQQLARHPFAALRLLRMTSPNVWLRHAALCLCVENTRAIATH